MIKLNVACKKQQATVLSEPYRLKLANVNLTPRKKIKNN